MKLILENWNKFLTLERKTDDAYERVAVFFLDLLLNRHEEYYYIYSPNRYSDEYFGDEYRPYGYNDDFYVAVIPNTIGDSIEVDPLHEEFLEATNQNFILQDEYEFEEAFNNLTYFLVPGENAPAVEGGSGEAAATMADDGELTVYSYPKKQLERLINLESDKEFEDIVIYGFEQIRETMIHELTHYINYFVSKRTRSDRRAKKTKKTTSKKGAQYANDTEEIQARMIDIFSAIIKEINDVFSGDVRFFFDYYDIENSKDFITTIIDGNVDWSVGYKDYLSYDLLTRANKQRVIKRLDDIYKNLYEKINDNGVGG